MYSEYVWFIWYKIQVSSIYNHTIIYRRTLGIIYSYRPYIRMKANDTCLKRESFKIEYFYETSKQKIHSSFQVFIKASLLKFIMKVV